MIEQTDGSMEVWDHLVIAIIRHETIEWTELKAWQIITNRFWSHLLIPVDLKIAGLNLKLPVSL